MTLEPLDGRIAVALEGDPADLDDACLAFPVGEVQVSKITIPPNEKYVLLSDALNGLASDSEIVRMAERLIDWINGALFLQDVRRRPIASQGIHHRQAANGEWGVTIARATVTVRGRSTGRFVADGPVGPTPQTLMMQKAMVDDNVREVLTYLSKVPDWIDLFKAFEVMRREIAGRLGEDGQQKIGWPGKNKIGTFTGDAQFDRHAKGNKWPKRARETAMPLHEARAFVRGLCSKWLASL
jgi:hypothetical protein